MKSPLQIPAKVRKQVIERDGGCCVICGRPTTDIHHIVNGGMGRRRCHHIANLMLMCDFPYENPCHKRVHEGKDSERLQRWTEARSRRMYGDVIDRIKKGEKLC